MLFKIPKNGKTFLVKRHATAPSKRKIRKTLKSYIKKRIPELDFTAVPGCFRGRRMAILFLTENGRAEILP